MGGVEFQHSQDEKSLEGSIQTALKDGIISKEEARDIQDIVGETEITDIARESWRKLSYDLRVEFQKAIGAQGDGAIGPEVLSKLNEKADRYAQESVGEFTESLEMPVSETLSEYDTLIKETRGELPDFIKDNQTGEVGITGIQNENDRWKLSRLQISTNNDNLAPNGKDDGLTFGIHSESIFRKNNNFISVSAGMDSFTNNPSLYYEDGLERKRDWDSESRRNDRGYIQVLGGKNLQYSREFSAKVYVGAGLQFDGNLGGQDIQNAWHTGLGSFSMPNGVYTVDAPYENGGKTNTSMYLKVGGDMRYNIGESLGKEFYAVAGGELQATVVGDGPTTLSAHGGIGFTSSYIDTEIGFEGRISTGEHSLSIENSGLDGSINPYIKVSASIGNKGPELFAKFTTSGGGQGTPYTSGQGSVGIGWNF